MAFPWYIIAIIALSGALLLAILAITLLRLLIAISKRKLKDDHTYSKLKADEGNETHEEQEEADLKSKKNHVSKFHETYDSSLRSSNDSDTLRSGQFLTVVKESYAESCYSDFDGASEKGSTASYVCADLRKGSAMMSDILSGSATRIQISLILNEEKKYLAGKIIKADGFPSHSEHGPHQIKFHLVFLPSRKYILKTRYHDITGAMKMDEYFKMKFRTLPDIDTSAIRIRVYGRRVKFGVAGREKCIGEVCIELAEFAYSRGGVTVWKYIWPKGMSKAIDDQKE